MWWKVISFMYNQLITDFQLSRYLHSTAYNHADYTAWPG